MMTGAIRTEGVQARKKGSAAAGRLKEKACDEGFGYLKHRENGEEKQEME